MDEVIETGWWCRECEFFETVDPTGSCKSCGCEGRRHTAVAVVAR